MPILAGFLGSIFYGVANFFSQYIARKYAVGIAAVAAMATITVALYAALSTILNGISFVLPSTPGMQVAAYIATPPAVVTGIGAAIACDIAIAVYRWNVANLKLLMVG